MKLYEFSQKFDIKADPENIEIDFLESRVSDISGVEAISSLIDKYDAVNKRVTLKHLSEDCIKLLLKADEKLEKRIVRSIDDPRYYVAANPSKFQ